MAKDADGNIIPEYGEGVETIELFDVSTGQYVTKEKDPNLDWSINGGQWKYGTMPDGSTIRLDATVPNWRDYGGMQTFEDGSGEWTYGYQNPPAPPSSPSWDDGLQGNLGTPQDPPQILQPTPPPVTPPPVAPTPPMDDPFTPTPPADDPFTPPPQAGLPPGSGNLPPPESPPGVVDPWTPHSGQDKSWKWDYFQPKSAGAGEWGGYDQNYGVFERYQPGQDSPWGMPDIEGGNREFYQQQFGNLLRDEQGYQNRERQAQHLRQIAQNNPPGAINYEDMWASMGITPNQAAQAGGEGGDPFAYFVNPNISGFEKGTTTNYDIFSALAPQLSSSAVNRFTEHFESDANREGTGWSRFTDPNALQQTFGSNTELNPGFRDSLNEMASLFLQRQDLTTPPGGGPTAAPGYALPV